MLPQEAERFYTYRARVVRVVDGDTFDLSIDLGFGVRKTERIRLARVDTPEMRGEERKAGLEAREFVDKMFSHIEWVVVRTDKGRRGKYGRYVAEILIPSDEGEVNLGDLLLEKGLAEEYSK
jgi:micrococcal nuclease